jgi:phage terminase large subunit-like protein
MPATRSGAAWLASAPAAVQTEFLEGLTEPELLALPYIFDFWALDHQLPPDGDWRTWVLMGGRGAGKTRAGAEWVRSHVEGSGPLDPGTARRVALIGETVDQVREVMIFGESGILACSPPDRRPDWIAGRKMLVWPNGAIAQVFSAHEPETLRGPQFDLVWADEMAKWKKGEETWDMIQFCLRLGEAPQACVTTTPRNAPALKSLLAQPTTVTTHATTMANAANLPPSFLEEVQRRYAGTRQGLQEIDGVLLADAEGALWTGDMIAACQRAVVPRLDRIVVAVDPAVSAHGTSDECGIVVVGAQMQGPVQDWRVWVLEDATVSSSSPTVWAEAAVAAFERHDAERLVAEVNQGGGLVETVIRQVSPLLPFKALHASKGKAMRAEPVAALYEQNRVYHARGLGKLEEQMTMMTTKGFQGRGSPDRVDALVWAIYELVLEPAQSWRKPRLRVL